MTSQADQKDIRILLVEDNESSGEALKKLLERFGHSVTHCLDGFEAINAIIMSKFDLAIIDLHMPKINGVELVKSIKHSNKDMPVIFTTGIPTDEMNIMLSKLDALDFHVLPKPILITTLLEKIANIFNEKIQ